MSTRQRSWPVPVALVGLSAIPLMAGTLRLIQLAGGPAVIPAAQPVTAPHSPQVLSKLEHSHEHLPHDIRDPR